MSIALSLSKSLMSRFVISGYFSRRRASVYACRSSYRSYSQRNRRKAGSAEEKLMGNDFHFVRFPDCYTVHVFLYRPCSCIGSEGFNYYRLQRVYFISFGLLSFSSGKNDFGKACWLYYGFHRSGSCLIDWLSVV